MPKHAHGRQGRINPWLDVLRTVAILLVLLRHGQRELALSSQGPLSVIETIALNGWVGVDLFFVLSGYLITRHLITAGLGTPYFSWRRYLTLRALRILPAYYAVLLLIVVGAFPLFPMSNDALGARFLYHLVFLQDYLPSDINVVFWSLGVEEKFYLTAPFVVGGMMMISGLRRRLLCLTILFIVPGLWRVAQFAAEPMTIDYPQFWQAYRSPFHMSLEGFVVGIGIALGQQHFRQAGARTFGFAVLGIAALGLVAWMASHVSVARISFIDASVQPPLIALLSGALVAGAVLLHRTPLPGARLFAFTSALAYTLYLTHFPVIPLARALTASSGVAAFWTLYLALSVGSALTIHIAVEKPFLRWKDRIARAAQRPLQPTPAAHPKDAIMLDTSGLNREAAMAEAMQLAEERLVAKGVMGG